MSETPEVGQLHSDTLENIFKTLRENAETVGTELPFPALGAAVRIRVTPNSGGQFFDMALLCAGDAEHEAHVADIRELQTEEEITAALVALRQQEAVRQMIGALLN